MSLQSTSARPITNRDDVTVHYEKTIELVEQVVFSKLPWPVRLKGPKGLTAKERRLIAEHLAGALEAFVRPEQW